MKKAKTTFFQNHIFIYLGMERLKMYGTFLFPEFLKYVEDNFLKTPELPLNIFRIQFYIY